MNTVMLKSVSFPGLGLDFELNPTMFQIGSLRITWYGFLIAVGMLLAMSFAYWKAPKFGVNRDRLMDAGLGGIIGGIIGARLYFVIFSWENYKDDLLSIFMTWQGGMAIYGGLIGGLLVGILVAKLRKIRLLPALDLACMGFLIGQSIGRWGNFINVEAFGGNTNLPWGMTSPSITSYLQEHMVDLTALGMDISTSNPVHPCFLYESLWCVLGFVLLCLYMKHRRFDGEIFLLYSAWYGFGRFWIEGLRTDSLLIGNLRVSQVLAGVVAAASIILLIVVRSRIRASHDPEYLKPYGQTQAWVEECAEEERKLREREERRAAKKAGKTAPAAEEKTEEAEKPADAADPAEPEEAEHTDESAETEEKQDEAD